MDCRSVFFTGHAVRRMFERAVRRGDVLAVLRSGETIEEYPDDQPLPSRLALGFVGERPIHIVVALEGDRRACYIVTVYEPDPELWDEGLQGEEAVVKCVLCRHGDTRPGDVTVVLQRGETTVIFKGVPADVCENCGEYYLSDAITEKTLAMAEEAVRKGAEVEILRFAA